MIIIVTVVGCQTPHAACVLQMQVQIPTNVGDPKTWASKTLVLGYAFLALIMVSIAVHCKPWLVVRSLRSLARCLQQCLPSLE
jgi:hypothetical protein